MTNDHIPIDWTSVVLAVLMIVVCVFCLLNPCILRRERQSPKGTSQLLLVIIPKGVESFVADMDSGTDSLQQNNRHILAEHIKYAPMFQKYYGPLDFDVRNYIK